MVTYWQLLRLMVSSRTFFSGRYVTPGWITCDASFTKWQREVRWRAQEQGANTSTTCNSQPIIHHPLVELVSKRGAVDVQFFCTHSSVKFNCHQHSSFLGPPRGVAKSTYHLCTFSIFSLFSMYVQRYNTAGQV